MAVEKKLVLGYCPQGNGTTIKPFDRVFDQSQDISRSINNVDAVVFWGGTDIHPSLYGQEPHKRTQTQADTPSHRDVFEWQAMKFCRANNIPMIGVCRGAQLLCAFAGGTLIQDCDGHVGRGDHMITMDDDAGGTKTLSATSCHHQMMYPFDVPHKMLAWSASHQGGYYEDDKGKVDMKDKVEPEIVYFPQINGLAIQGHPEWAVHTPFANLCNEYIKAMLLPVMET